VLSNTTWRILQDYLNLDRARLIKAYGAEDAGPLFLSESNVNAGQPISKWAVTKIFDEIRDALGLPQLTPHKLRHLMLTHLMDYGLDLYARQPLCQTSLHCQYGNLCPCGRCQTCSPAEPHP
jgi:site-specific recombinase XerD